MWRPLPLPESLEQALAEILPVVLGNFGIADAPGQALQISFESRAPFGCRKIASLCLSRPQHIRQRLCLSEQRLKRLGALATDQRIRILVFGQEHKAQRLSRHQVRQGQMAGALCGAQTRLIAVETTNRLRTDAPQQRQLVFGEGGAERSHRAVEARPNQRDDIHIAFGQDQRRAFMRGLACLMQVVELPAFGKERCLA